MIVTQYSHKPLSGDDLWKRAQILRENPKADVRGVRADPAHAPVVIVVPDLPPDYKRPPRQKQRKTWAQVLRQRRIDKLHAHIRETDPEHAEARIAALKAATARLLAAKRIKANKRRSEKLRLTESRLRIAHLRSQVAASVPAPENNPDAIAPGSFPAFEVSPSAPSASPVHQSAHAEQQPA